MAMLLLPDEI